jgi:inner membrane transporter RhtA
MPINSSVPLQIPQARAAGTQPAKRASAKRVGSIPPTALVLLSAISLEFGGALAKTLFAALGPAGAVTVRVSLAAVALLFIWRPNLRHVSRSGIGTVVPFGLALAAMNLSFYLALSRLPLGVAVTIELVGPLGVAAVNSRRWTDLLWVLLAATGIAAFAPISIGASAGLDPLGLGLAMLSGVFSAVYMLLSARTGRVFADGSGLALALAVAAIALLPIGITGAAMGLLLHPELLVVGAAVALLSSVVPYSLDLAALRQLPTRVFGILVSLEPAIAAGTGWLVLHEQLESRSLIGIALVTAASAGAARAHRGTCSSANAQI